MCSAKTLADQGADLVLFPDVDLATAVLGHDDLERRNTSGSISILDQWGP